jgi:proteic killer suppression protein
MNISFYSKKLEKLANDDRKLLKEYGKVMASKIRLRLTQLRDANTLEDVRSLPGRFHELTDNRKGQWACDLVQPYRLVFEPHEKPVLVDDHGCYIWVAIKGVEIIEITDYHKEK